MFKVTLTGMAGQKAQFASISDQLTRIVASEVEDAAKRWVAGAKRDAPVDEATLKGLITYSIRSKYSFLIISQAMYSPYMEFGTKGKYRSIPGTEAIAAAFKGGSHGDFMAMLKAILRWVHRKGITGIYSIKTKKRLGSKVNQYAEDYSAAWPIALSILKNGVSPHPFFFKQGDTVWPQMVSNIERRLSAATKVSVILPGQATTPKIITV